MNFLLLTLAIYLYTSCGISLLISLSIDWGANSVCRVVVYKRDDIGNPYEMFNTVTGA